MYTLTNLVLHFRSKFSKFIKALPQTSSKYINQMY